MLGFADQITVRYIGCYLATGAYISNWAALNSYQANNITGFVILTAYFRKLTHDLANGNEPLLRYGHSL